MTLERYLLLHVDAEARHRAARTGRLAEQGFRVREACTPAEALEPGAPAPDLALIAGDFPTESGLGLCQALKRQAGTQFVPVLLLVIPGKVPPEVEGGPDALLVEPADAAEVSATLSLLRRLRRAELASGRLAQLEDEIRVLELRVAVPTAAVTAHLFGVQPLSESAPSVHRGLVDALAQLLERALEQRQYRVSLNVSEKLRAMGDQLGFNRATARDVIDIYSAALKRKTEGVPEQKVQAFVEEGRLLTLELMGHLVAHYRLLSLGSKPPSREVPHE